MGNYTRVYAVQRTTVGGAIKLLFGIDRAREQNIDLRTYAFDALEDCEMDKEFKRKADEIFRFYKFSIFEQLTELDTVVARFIQDAGLDRIPLAQTQEYVQTELIEMIKTVAEQREAKNRRRTMRKTGG